MNRDKKNNILWIDCIGGLAVGVLVLCACQQISKWDNLPLWIILGVGIANLVYGGFSIWVTTRKPRPTVLVKTLALANIAWLLVCIAIVFSHWSTISVFGVIHKLGEGLYVASLGLIEWRWRKSLSS